MSLYNITLIFYMHIQGLYSRSCCSLSSSRYNVGLVTWAVVRLTAANFRLLIFVFSVSCIALSIIGNICTFMLLDDLCLLPVQTNSQSKLYYDRRSVGQSLFVSGNHMSPVTNVSLLSIIIFRQLLLSWCARPLWREDGSVDFLGFEYPKTHYHILLSQFS
jgi:hypothetical protein